MILVVMTLLPPIAALISCLMLGILIRECSVFLDIVTVFISTGIGSTMSAATFVNLKTLR
jgi:oxaloacetate decarboxylase beta subunit/glutaconyl-CoA decarboxylase